MQLRFTTTVLLLLLAAACHHRAIRYTSAEPCPDELLDRFIHGDPIDKMGASTLLGQNQCTRAVPYLLAEMRDHYGPIDCGDHADITAPCYVLRDGKKVPYIDYHAPIFTALSRLSVPYFEPDSAWYEAIESWIKNNLHTSE